MNETSVFDAQEIHTMCGVLATKDTAWGDRINALEHLRELTTAATEGSSHSVDAATLARRLEPLVGPLQVQLTELRSAIIKEAC
eukprot:COSAG01_NODE_16855_length_1198_cov_6.101001_2_plen_83_part_01